MKTIVCQRCGKSFTGYPNRKYCHDCSAEAYKESTKRWCWLNYEQLAKKKREYYLTNAGKIREQKHQYYLAQAAKKRARKELSP